MSDKLNQSTPTPLDLRDMLEAMVHADLLGPVGGATEILDEANVRDRYIVGRLAPYGQSISPDEQDELALDGSGDDNQDGQAERESLQSATIFPSAIGLTFTVDGAADALQITALWGQYRRVKAEDVPAYRGTSNLVWQRQPVEGVLPDIPLRNGEIPPFFPDPENEAVYVRGRCRKRGETWTVTLFLVNAQAEPKIRKDEAWLFQPELIVTDPNGKAIFMRRHLPDDLTVNEPEDRAMNMLYRREVEFAVGHNVAVHVELAAGHWDKAIAIRTDVIPAYEVERMEPPTAAEIPELGQAVFDMKRLAETDMGGFTAAVAPLTNAYEDWLDRQAAQLENPAPDLQPYRVEAAEAITHARETLARMRDGLALLDSHPDAAEAFRFANRAMWQQRVRSIFARQVRQGQTPDETAIDIPKNRSWRPFQLAFVLLNLPGLVDPTHPNRSHPTDALADLLWFPTGGGKTEAYLGVAAFAMAIRRLQPELGGLSGQAGVSVLMRYTLRLLTLQQFQRAATLIAACEVIRREAPDKWGDEPFRIGLWVGQRSTPNWTKHAAEAIKKDHNLGWGGGNIGGRGTPYQLTNCPWCGRPIDPGKNILVETHTQGRGRTFQFCGDKLGRCPFSRRQSPDEGLPIVVVDEEIYRRLPTLLIATVDKFAQMPWKGAAQMLFGRVNGYCPRHGFRSPEIEDADSHPKKGNLPACKTKPVNNLRPPDLIIQDELHLISGPLGTLVGLYETAVDRLASWQLGDTTVRPKVIASTATIRRANSQVNSLFLRQVKIFPPAVLNAEDNFFARRRPSDNRAPGRRYLGISAPGTRLKLALIRVYVAYLSAAQKLYKQYGTHADPWMTLVGYFNSMRELGGMRRVVDDAVRTRLQKMAARGLANRFIEPFNVEELTSRKGATDIPRILDRLETTFDPHRVKKKNRKYPLDVVLATNMISVGVDVSRLGLMVVAGQPKATAEYIQATSRVGRAFPGLVCTVYNWARPRDLSHYERFEHYHATFYQQVEALSVTPFSSRALDRGLTGILVSLIRLLGEEFNPNEAAGAIDRTHPFVQQALKIIRNRAELVTASTGAGSQTETSINQRLDIWLSKVVNLKSPAILGYRSKKDGRTINLLKTPSEEDWDKFTCLNSLRDVEPEVSLILKDQGMDT